MALTLNQFIGVETGGLEEFPTTAGTPTASTAQVRSGAFSVLINASGETVSFDPLQLVASGGTGTIIGFGVWPDSLDPIGDLPMVRFAESGGQVMTLFFQEPDATTIELRNQFNGVVDTFPNSLVAGQWNYVEFFFEHLDSASYELFVDGVSKGSGSGADFNRGGAFNNVTFSNTGDTTVITYYDDIYVLTGATAASDRLGDTLGVEVFKYQSAKASNVPDDGGGNLDVGNWGDSGETPLNEANVAVYQNAGAGAVDSNTADGSPEGPSGDSRIDGDSNIKGIKGVWRMKRSGGGGSDHFGLLGNNVDGTTRSADFNPDMQFADFFFLSEAATIVPLSTEFCRIGFETTGGQDFNCADMWAMILHVPDEVAPSTERHQTRRIITPTGFH